MSNKTSSVMEMLGGKVGITKSNGRIIMHIIKPRKRAKASPSQQRVNNKFIVATAYAKRQMADPVRKALYQAAITRAKQSAYAVAMTDALTAPVVHEIDTSGYDGAAGDIITIGATDDFKVERVKVIITSSNGTELECGDAVVDECNPFIWNYTTRVVNPDIKGTNVSATAFDYPGNRATLATVVERSASVIATVKSKRTPRKLHSGKLRTAKH